ncbi:hypothetical protein RB195_009035 [Necator americanus]|uniref:CCDC92/74 N-terminal domain-containing protein n=1 Tax=Necator americanus TaxID=51031 RepID=A0ABR1CSP7_NECAM
MITFILQKSFAHGNGTFSSTLRDERRMSTGLAVNRPPPENLAFKVPHPNDMEASSSSSNELQQAPPPSSRNQQTQTNKFLYESDLELRLREAIRKRDEQWRKHEREQISFLQNETATMLRGLHKEIERLGHQLKDAKRQLYVPDDSPCDHSEMEAKIEQQEERIRALEQQIRDKEQHATDVEDKIAETVEKLQEQINIQADRIRELSAELNDRNQTVAHLSSQTYAESLPINPLRFRFIASACLGGYLIFGCDRTAFEMRWPPLNNDVELHRRIVPVQVQSFLLRLLIGYFRQKAFSPLLLRFPIRAIKICLANALEVLIGY